MNDKRKIHEDRPWWVDKEPNVARLMMAVQRGAVILGKDHVKILSKFKQEKIGGDQNGQ